MVEHVTDVIHQRVDGTRVLNERSRIDLCGLIECAIESSVDGIGALGGGLGGIDLELRGRLTALQAVERRKITKNGLGVEKILTQFVSARINPARRSQRGVQAAQDVGQEEHRL